MEASTRQSDQVPLLLWDATIGIFLLRWYTTIGIPLEVFSGTVPDEVRDSVAHRLLAVEPDKILAIPGDRYGTGHGKPSFPIINDATELCDLVTLDS